MSIPNDPKLIAAHQSSFTHAESSQRYPFFKRVMDVTGAVSFLIVFSPLIGLIALLVRLSGPGVIFAHTRVGRGDGCSPVINSAPWCLMPKPSWIAYWLSNLLCRPSGKRISN